VTRAAGDSCRRSQARALLGAAITPEGRGGSRESALAVSGAALGGPGTSITARTGKGAGRNQKPVVGRFWASDEVPDKLNLRHALRELFIVREWARKLSDYLDARLLFEEAPKYDIIQVDFWDPFEWRDGSIAKIGNDGLYYFLHLNPDLDRSAAAKWLSKRIGLRIKPEEVYTFAFFHECGHTPAAVGKRCHGAAAALEFFRGGMKDGELITDGLITRRRRDQEDEKRLALSPTRIVIVAVWGDFEARFSG